MFRIDFSGAPEEIDRDIAALRQWFHEFLGKRRFLPTTGGSHFVTTSSTDEMASHIGLLAGMSYTVVRELLMAVENANNPIDLREMRTCGHADDSEPMLKALKEIEKNLAAVKKLLTKKDTKRK